jgi:hypothetical protein
MSVLVFILEWALSWLGRYPSRRWEYLKGPQTSHYWCMSLVRSWFLALLSFLFGRPTGVPAPTSDTSCCVVECGYGWGLGW